MIDKLQGTCTSYVQGKYTLTINFPANDIACCYCPYKRYKDAASGRRNICSLTYEPLENSGSTIGTECPLEWEDKR